MYYLNSYAYNAYYMLHPLNGGYQETDFLAFKYMNVDLYTLILSPFCKTPSKMEDFMNRLFQINIDL